jgi:N,N-dimethylformamidase
VLAAYLGATCVSPGDQVEAMVSTDAPNVNARVVRLIHGDPNPEGPGVVEEDALWSGAGDQIGEQQPLITGSWIELPLNPAGSQSLTLAFWVYWTGNSSSEQTLASLRHQGTEILRLTIRSDSRLEAAIREPGEVVLLTSPSPIHRRRWYFVGISANAPTGQMGIFCAERGTSVFSVERAKVKWQGIPQYPDSLLLGASLENGAVQNSFNGKIGGIRIFEGLLDDIDLSDLKQGAELVGGQCEGAWDLGRRTGGTRIIDISGHGRHGQVHNGAARAVTGPNWQEIDTTIGSAPRLYDAVHLHDDDLADAEWLPTFTFSIPSGAQSGIYAVRLSTNEEEVALSLVVGPQRKSKAPVLFLVPTLTWLAYANFDSADKHDIGLSLYDSHSDGSPNYYASQRKPTSSTRPDAYFEPEETGGGSVPQTHASVPGMPDNATHLVMADLYVIHWLEHLGIQYEVMGDEDLHRLGAEALTSYSAIICAGHHEYWTPEMLDALETYLEAGGNLQYMAGNGLYWPTSIDPERPHLIEVRRRGGTATNQAEPGELQHNSTGLLGGTWSLHGRSSHRLVGIGMAGQGFGRAPGFQRLPDSLNPLVGFIFEGIHFEERIGDFGLNLGGAGGFEFDRIDRMEGTPSSTLLLASTVEVPSSFYRAMEHGVGRGPNDPLVRADMVYLNRGSGSVFSVGSITWTGSLSHNGYNNNVARVSTNVLTEFISRVPPRLLTDSNFDK